MSSRGRVKRNLEVRPASARSLGGAGICAFALAFLWLFDDDKSLGQESESAENAEKWIFANQ